MCFLVFFFAKYISFEQVHSQPQFGLLFQMHLMCVLNNCMLLGDPMKWSEVQVSQWLDWAVHEFGFNPINKTNWQLSGLQLCALSKEEFLEKAPPYIGDILHSHLNLLKAKGNYDDVI